MSRWIALLALTVTGCFEETPPALEQPDETTSTTDPTVTQGPSVGSDDTSGMTPTPSSGDDTTGSVSATTAGPGTTSTTDETSSSTGGDDSSTGTPAACGDGIASPGELCFDTPVVADTINPVQAIAVGDMSGNGVLDVVSSEGNDGEAYIYFGTGTGTFASESGEAFAPTTVDVALGQFTSPDDNIDAVWATTNDDAPVSVMISDGAGTFIIPTPVPAEMSGATVTTADLDNDDLDDIITVGPSSANASTSRVATFFAEGDGTFGTPQSATTPHGQYLDIVAAEFTGNDRVDIAYLYILGASTQLRSCRGNGTGVFGNATCDNRTAGDGAARLAAGDLDDDGSVDIIVSRRSGSSVGFFPGNGTGTFGMPTEINVGEATLAIATGDLDNDGVTDAAVAGVDGAISIILGGGGPLGVTTVLDSPPSGGCGPSALELGDFNADGALDLVMSCTKANQLIVFNSDA